VRIRWSMKAMEQRERILRYIAEDSVEAAIPIDLRMESEATVLARFPYLGRRSLQGAFRVLTVRGTDYLIAYRIDGDVVDISAVFHGARDQQQEPWSISPVIGYP
jgi:toxin ParE1/3/4